jgi:hypothetical protein
VTENSTPVGSVSVSRTYPRPERSLGYIFFILPFSQLLGLGRKNSQATSWVGSRAAYSAELRLLQDRLQKAKRLARFVANYQLQHGVDQPAIQPVHHPVLA